MSFTAVNPSDSAQTERILVKTANHTLKRSECPCIVTNEGATGAVVVTLPQDAKGGERVTGIVRAAQHLRFDPGSAGAIFCHNGTSFAKQTDDKYVGSNTADHRIILVAMGGGDWYAVLQDNGAGAVGFNTVET